MAISVTQKLKSFLVYREAIEGCGFYLCLFDKLLKTEKVRMIRLGDTDLYVRTNTPDTSVAISSLFHQEYSHIRCANPKNIIDLGANIGTSTIFFAKKYPSARIIAIEPEDGNFELLLKNTRNFANITAVKAAIWGVPDKRTIQNRFTGHWGYTVSDTDNKIESTGQEIDCVTISSLMKKYDIGTIDLLKMDIEGSEKHVLEHSSDWIDSVEIMTVELHDRICMGCDRAFYLATKDFVNFEKHGEKVTAYRH